MPVMLATETTAGTTNLLPGAVMWHAELAADGMLRVRIDRQDMSANALSRGMLEELERLLAEIRRTQGVRGAMFFSGKPGNFIVGADVNELKSLGSGSSLSIMPPLSSPLTEGTGERDSGLPAGARGPDVGAAVQARELSQFGQCVFEQLEALPIPTVALISGACLGGGLEFALSCRYRIADDHAKTLLGLPEVKLGLIPGWGGTVRLPKLVGLADALPMILTGRVLNGRQAKSKGLVDDTVPTEGLPLVGELLLHTVITRGSARSLFKSAKRSLLLRVVELVPPLRNLLVFRRAEKETLKQTRGHYPAPPAAIETMRVGFRQPSQVGFAAESAAIGRLADAPVTRECLRLFFLQEDAKKLTHLSGERGMSTPALSGEINGHQRADAPHSPMNAAVIGAGAMGAGIALLMAQKGIWTRLKDLKPEFVAKGMQTIRKLTQTDLQRRRVTPLQATDTLDHLRPTTEYDGLKHADIVIEAVIEDVSIKQQVFRDLAEATGPGTVLATNTSSLLVRDIAAGVPHPERVVGLHFFNPPHQMPLVEVVCTEQSSPGAVAAAFALAQRLGKTAVIVEDCAGFLVNRLLAPYMNEAGFLLLEVSDPLEIDRAAVSFGLPMGPLELTDLVGLEVARHVAENMHVAYGERMAPAPLWAALKELSTQPQKGRPSLLVGKDRRKKLNPTVRRAIANVRQSGQFTVPGGTPSRDEITQRLIFPIINEAARCLDEGIVSRPDEIDLAMVFGTGFAPFRGGPMRYAETLGLSTIVSVLEQLAATRPRLAPSDALRRMASGP